MIAYLVRLHHFLVFLARDPKFACGLPVEPAVRLDDAKAAEPTVHSPIGLCVGVDPVDDHHYRVFHSMLDRAHAGFHQVVGMPVVVPEWDDFLEVAKNCCVDSPDASKRAGSDLMGSALPSPLSA